jgi:hypothetical protein
MAEEILSSVLCRAGMCRGKERLCVCSANTCVNAVWVWCPDLAGGHVSPPESGPSGTESECGKLL